jgi:4-hydroxy-tetrahydrodipicolinate synthase
MPATFPAYKAEGVIPACLLPFHEDLSVDFAGYKAHLRDVAGTRGINGITVNAHASEVSSCDYAEQVAVLDATMEAIGDTTPIINGVYSDSTLQAVKLAKMAAAGGASCLLVFPPNVLARGHAASPGNMADHVRAVAAATDLPLILFQYGMNTGLTYPLATLLELAAEIPQIKAIKDGSGDPVLAERHVVALQGLSRPVNVLSTHSAWLMGSLVGGCKGLLSGSGSVIAALQVELFEAVQRQDLAEAQRLNALIRPTAEAFYAQPSFDMHNRMKEALVMLGRMQRAVVRPPLRKLGTAELARIRTAITAAGLEPRLMMAAE